MNKVLTRLVSGLPLVGLFVLAGLALSLLGDSAPARAQSAPSKVCRAVMILDRSGSIDSSEMQRMRNQVRRLFEPTGLYDENIHLAFWTFSNDAGVNYNSPFHTFVSSKGPISPTFNASLNSISSGGNTNYQQGFAYNGNTRNPQLNDIIEPADILVFMTDGEPNQPPGGGIFGGLTPEEAGRQAAQKHIDAGRAVIGGSIGNGDAQRRVINYVVSGDRNNYNSTFPISGTFGDLAEKLKQEIGNKCDQLFPPEPCEFNPDLPKDSPDCKPPIPNPPYSLTPGVTTDSAVVSSDDSAHLTYRVTNSSLTVNSPDTSWSISRVIVNKTQSADPLFYGSETFKNDFSCQQLMGLINGKGNCTPNIASGTKQFPHGPNPTVLNDAEVGSASRVIIDDSWDIGDKVCYVLVINKPTEQAAPGNRYSRAACVVIGKRPTVQVLGGDITVGRTFETDPEPLGTAASTIQTGVTVKGDPVNKIFGSWVEYGAFAPGPIKGLATAAGLEGGHAMATGEIQSLWSKLTFGNMNGEYGFFSDATTIGDGPATLLANNSVIEDITTNDKAFNGAVTSGIYRKQTGDLTLHGGILDAGSSVIVHVPNGTVTIDGSLAYNDGPYNSIKEIPRLVIIARNINIQGNVGNVDAWLVARNSATSNGGGTVNTCSDWPQVRLSINECSLPLRVNGPIMARHLLLRRTAGAGIGAASSDPAEVINLRADTYLSSLARRSDAVVPTTTYTVELPPRF